MNDLIGYQSKLHDFLRLHVPDWEILDEYVAALDAPVTSELFTLTLEKGDTKDLIAMKKTIDKDIASVKLKISDEEDKISDYMVLSIISGLIQNYVTRRRRSDSYTAFIKCMLQKLAEKNLIKPLIS